MQRDSRTDKQDIYLHLTSSPKYSQKYNYLRESGLRKSCKKWVVLQVFCVFMVDIQIYIKKKSNDYPLFTGFS